MQNIMRISNGLEISTYARMDQGCIIMLTLVE